MCLCNVLILCAFFLCAEMANQVLHTDETLDELMTLSSDSAPEYDSEISEDKDIVINLEDIDAF